MRALARCAELVDSGHEAESRGDVALAFVEREKGQFFWTLGQEQRGGQVETVSTPRVSCIEYSNDLGPDRTLRVHDPELCDQPFINTAQITPAGTTQLRLEKI